MQQKQPSLDDVNVTVIRSLQDQLIQTSQGGPVERAPGSQNAIRLERAIDYAASVKRKRNNPKFLEFDVLRNAKSSAYRSAMSQARLLRAIAALSAPRHQAFNGNIQANLHLLPVGQQERPGTHTSGPGGRAAGTTMAVQTTPEDEVIARDLEECIRTKVAATLGQIACDVLDDMLLEKSISDTAERLGISDRTVDRTRLDIRKLAKPILRPESIAA